MVNAKTAASKPGPGRVKEDILAIATEEFAKHGLSGARVDAIAERTRTTKGMIYYYFASKEALFTAVLEAAYADIRRAESALQLDALEPEDAIRRLVEFTFDYDDAHPEFVRLISIENIHNAAYLGTSSALQNINLPAIDLVAAILARGRRQGVFKRDAPPVDVHFMISSLCFFRVSNRHTFGSLFGFDLAAPEIRRRHRRMIGNAVLAYLRAP